MKLLIVINKEAWAVGTLARLLLAGAPEGWMIRLISSREMSCNPSVFRKAVEEADLVHWMLHRTFAGAADYVRAGCHVVSLHHLDADELDLGYLMKARGIVTDASRYTEIIQARLGSAMAVECIPLPVDDVFFQCGTMRRKPAPYSARTGKPFRIGFFAAAEYENDRKGIDLLPAVITGLQEKGLNVEVSVAGLGWHKRVRRLEFRSLPVTVRSVPSYWDMPAAYAELDAYLCLSRTEGGPLPVFEAMACGVPVVSTEVGMIPDILDAGTMYRKIPCDDSVRAVERLVELIRSVDGGWDMCRRAKNAVEQRLSVMEYRRRQLAFYGRILGLTQEVSPRSDPAGAAVLQRKWRAWDRVYWAKELWSAGRKVTALRFMAGALILDPACAGIWRIPRRLVGLDRDEVPFLKQCAGAR